LLCSKCKKSAYLAALSTGKCKVCGKPTPTPHIPSYKVCRQCSEENNLREQYGEKGETRLD